MKPIQSFRSLSAKRGLAVVLLIGGILIIGGIVAKMPHTKIVAPKAHDSHEAADHHDSHDEHDEHVHKEYADHRHDDDAAVQLSSAAQGNLGVKTAVVALKPFERTITVPAIVVERPGQSHLQIAAPLTGVVTRIYPSQGETVAPGDPLFDLRLTHEEVVESQGAFLQTAEELDVVGREIERLERIAEGAIAGKTLLERKYEQQKLNATLRSQRQRLLLHGLSAQQVDQILTERKLLSEMTVFVPCDTAAEKKRPSPSLQVERLHVDKGQHVNAGELLCLLMDYSELYLQGKAFEQDIPAIENAANRDWRVTTMAPSVDGQPQKLSDLKILSLSNRVEPESRAFLFYVALPNRRIRDDREPDGRRFCTWQFKPGQRMELLVPVERWTDRIVLPRDAVVQDGGESYVFEQNDGHFDRRAVRIEYSDPYSVVLANDGVLTLGKTVVVDGAYQIHLALKNKTGGAPDPHAGHNH
jgi:multidrug efflux pump subunit AcrA (membrane-fusion protein)